MQEYLVKLQTKVEVPQYRLNAPSMDIRSIAHDNMPGLMDINVLETWPAIQEAGVSSNNPDDMTSGMDKSQIEALKRILTKKLAIIQGPPGTGKTYTSVTAIKVLLQNMTANDPPIIVAAQTNHAVDQILRHISRFEPSFIRLGGQTADQDVIKPRTLHELKASKKPLFSSSTRTAGNIRRVVGNELDILLQPFQLNELISADIFFENGLLHETQRDSINQMESKWVSDSSPNKMNLWCNNRMTKIINADKADAYATQFEEEHENLDEKELEAPDNDDEKYEHLHGRKFELCSGFRAIGAPNYISDGDIKALLSKERDLQAVPDQYRPEVYDYLRRQLIERTTAAVRENAQRCRAATTIGKLGRWETDYEFLSTVKVIGLTTTGLSKYRGLLSVLGPRIVVIEEAAETLEPYTVAALFDTLQHLVLVGDHQQLRASCACSSLIGGDINFDISLFERMVKNEVEYTRLNTQRRMRPEIRQLIKHIYPDLADHSAVMNRPNVAGTGGSNVWWWHHANEESIDDSKSKQNHVEARMTVEFTKYLVWNNISLQKITILTFYNGQKKLLLTMFRQHELFKGHRIKVCTVDSYQGEENDLILLSLVRSNEMGNIGFLNSINRACVALSRARMGFYIFGNAKLLFGSEDWSKVIAELQAQDAVRTYLPLYCPVHEQMVNAKNYTDLEGLNGGCDEFCKKPLSCGHRCPLKCHPGRDCNKEDCEEPCLKVHPCGHPCTAGCAGICICRPCSERLKRQTELAHFEAIRDQAIAVGVGNSDAHSLAFNQGASLRGIQPLQRATPADITGQRDRWAKFTASRLEHAAEMASARTINEANYRKKVANDLLTSKKAENTPVAKVQPSEPSIKPTGKSTGGQEYSNDAVEQLIDIAEAATISDTDLINRRPTTDYTKHSLI